MSRMRAGEWIAAAGAVGLFVVLFFDWFGASKATYAPATPGGNIETFSIGSLSGWSTLGWFMIVLLCVQIFGGGVLAYMTVKRASPAWPVGAAVLSWLVGSLIFLVLLVRVTIAQPTGFDELLSVQWPAYLGLVFSFLIPLGGFLSLRDERTHSPEAQAYMPPPARTAPGT
ncbi:hypothetical protein DSM104299_02576 [Baekduia alba]|uniref:hypothetical protein n=1 Tax=Baekduia alba TaxID=2997333 RepID=UPI00234213C2|nr:hypothetical protein [Baekduia alba]WCB93856.1 hypothetical protein DSM104299_02576 [Baekduia alba]